MKKRVAKGLIIGEAWRHMQKLRDMDVEEARRKERVATGAATTPASLSTSISVLGQFKKRKQATAGEPPTADEENSEKQLKV